MVHETPALDYNFPEMPRFNTETNETVPYGSPEDWQLTFYGIDPSPKQEKQTELLTTLLNGTLTATVPCDARWPLQHRAVNPRQPQSTSTRQIFELTPAQNGLPPELQEKVSSIPTNINGPVYFNFGLKINGQATALDENSLVRTLNLQNRVLEVSGQMVTEMGDRADFTTTMFLHYDQPYWQIENIALTPQQDCQLTILDGIDATRPPEFQHYFSPEPAEVEVMPKSHCLTYAGKTASGQAFAQSQRLDLYGPNGEPIDTVPQLVTDPKRPNKYIQQIIIDSKADQTCQVLSFGSFQTADPDREKLFHGPWARPKGMSQLSLARRRSFEELLTSHNAKWQEQWQQVTIPLINGDPQAQTAIFHSLSTIIADLGADHTGYLLAGQGAKIANKPGEGYYGHTFWEHDTAVPEVSSLQQRHEQLMRRYYQLPSARAKAEKLGFKGAFWGWETTKPSHGESGPEFLANPAGIAKVEVLESGVHLPADIVHEIIEYYRLSGEPKFLEKMGAEMVQATAEFLISRAKFDEETGTYGFYNVTGPDEYHENVDRDAYTQIMAAHAMRFAVELAEGGLIDIPESTLEEWNTFRRKLHLPFDPETLEFTAFDGWNELEHLSLGPESPYYQVTQMDKQLQEETVQVALHDYLQAHPWPGRTSGLTEEAYRNKALVNIRDNLTHEQRHRISKTDVLKQPNVILMLVMLDEQVIDLIEDRWGEATINQLMAQHGGNRAGLMQAIYKANVDKYNPQTSHGSSLSPTICLISELDAIRDQHRPTNIDHLYDMWRQALFMDMGQADTHDTSKGLHTANMASSVWAVTRGFMGLKAVSGSLHVNPCIPSVLSSISCLTKSYGQTIEIIAEQNGQIIVKLIEDKGNNVPMNIAGVAVELNSDNPYLIVQNGQPISDEPDEDQAA